MSIITHAMILAAGRGQRMSPITDRIPKPLISVRGKSLIAYHLERIANAGIQNVVINHAWLGKQICNYVGDGNRFGLNVEYSAEQPALETAGGIAKALPLLGKAPFVVINADIWTDFNLSQLPSLREGDVGHLVMVPNPEHNEHGDFSLQNNRISDGAASERLTFSGISVYRPNFFANVPVRSEPLAPWLRYWMEQGKVSGQYYQGHWCDVGTPQRLESLEQELS
jgi:MurNAc alpha-1-phosphate uridylyltransferase